jgi:hypothetical protein
MGELTFEKQDGWYGSWDMDTGARIPWHAGKTLRAAR